MGIFHMRTGWGMAQGKGVYECGNGLVLAVNIRGVFVEVMQRIGFRGFELCGDFAV